MRYYKVKTIEKYVNNLNEGYGKVIKVDVGYLDIDGVTVKFPEIVAGIIAIYDGTNSKGFKSSKECYESLIENISTFLKDKKRNTIIWRVYPEITKLHEKIEATKCVNDHTYKKYKWDKYPKCPICNDDAFVITDKGPLFYGYARVNAI